MSTMQQSPIAPMNMFQPRWRDAILQTTLDSIFLIYDERLGMDSKVGLLSWKVSFPKGL